MKYNTYIQLKNHPSTTAKDERHKKDRPSKNSQRSDRSVSSSSLSGSSRSPRRDNARKPIRRSSGSSSNKDRRACHSSNRSFCILYIIINHVHFDVQYFMMNAIHINCCNLDFL